MPFYAVRVGRNPGIYQTWPECLDQVTGFPKPIFQRFDVEGDAIKFVQGTDPTPSPSSPKFYAVRNGKKPGIYLTWSECEAQITGWKKPEFKKFDRREDALLFIQSKNSLKLKRPFHNSRSRRSRLVGKVKKYLFVFRFSILILQLQSISPLHFYFCLVN